MAGWPQAVGELVARNAWPARIARDGTLLVNTKDAVWAFELGHRGPEILGRLDRRLKGIRFVPGPIPELAPESAETPSPTPDPPTPEQLERGAELAAGIADEELRERVAQAAAASLARASDGRSVW